MSALRYCFLFMIYVSAFLLCSCYSDKPRKTPATETNMREVLADLYNQQKFPGCFIRNDLAIKYFEEEIGKTSSGNRLERCKLEVGLAHQLLSSNKVDESIDLYKKLLRQIPQFTEISSGEKTEAIDMLENALCVAFVRKGELQNCATNHNSASCILPFQSPALHRDKSGSDSAIVHLIQYLNAHPNDSRMIWLLNIAAATINRHPDVVPPMYRVDFGKYSRENSFEKFTDVALEKGVNSFGHFGGAGVDDFNNDSLPDIFVTSTPLNANVHLYLQTRDSGFIDFTDQAGLSGITGGGNTHHADFDNDGWLDVFISRGGWLGAGGFQPNSLLRNLGNGKFEDVTAKAGLFSYKITHSACWADFNNDGWLDLFVGNENQSFDEYNAGPFANSGSELFLNNKNGTFTNVSNECGININAWVKGCVWFDYNNDALPDLYVSIFGGKNLLYRNDGAIANGNNHFTEVAEQAGVSLPVYSFPAAAFDINQDGWEDLFVNGFNTDNTSMALEYMDRIKPENPVMIFINQKDGTFKEAAKEMGVNRSIYAMALNYGDIDADGFPDIYMGTGYGDLAALFPNILLQNKNGKKFLDVTSSSGTGHLQKGHGIAIADIDCDGDNDIYAELGGFLEGDWFWNANFDNPGNSNQWIVLRLEGTSANRNAIGARVTISVNTTSGSQKIFTRISTGGSYGCSPLQQLVGLGNAVGVDKIEVYWPGKTTPQVFTGMQQKKAYKLTQNKLMPEEMEYKVIKKTADKKLHYH